MDRITSIEKSQKDAGMAIALLLILVGLYLKSNTFYFLSALILLITMTIPRALKYPTLFWFGLSEVMGKVMSKVLLTLIFFMIISPIAIVMRVLGKDQLKLKDQKGESAFIDRMKEYGPQDLKNPF